MGDFNSHNILWGSIVRIGRIVKRLLDKNNYARLVTKQAHTYIQQQEHIWSWDPTIYIDYNWLIHNDTCEWPFPHHTKKWKAETQ